MIIKVAVKSLKLENKTTFWHEHTIAYTEVNDYANLIGSCFPNLPTLHVVLFQA